MVDKKHPFSLVPKLFMRAAGFKKMRIVRRKTRKLGMELFESIPDNAVYIVQPNMTIVYAGCTHPNCKDPQHFEMGVAAVREDGSDGGEWGYVPLDLLEDVPEQVN
jgi:hypothetical protein